VTVPSLLRSSIGGRLLIAERFLAPCARLSEIVLPLDVLAREPVSRLLLVVISERGGEERTSILAQPQLSDRDTLRLAFAPFDSVANDAFLLGAIDANASDGSGDLAEWDALHSIRESAADRTPIALECRGESASSDDLIRDERGIAVFRMKKQGRSAIRTASWIDAFWCDASGVYLRGWVHAYEHRVRALRLESAGRSARVDVFADRPDLLRHYPEHEHVRHGGFAIYLACPPAHAVTMTLETDGGEATVSLALPEGPIPPWKSEPEAGDTLTPTLRRFVGLAKERGGRVLQIGSRVPRGEDAVPPRHLFERLIGLDIHPGCNVDLVGDAHLLSQFLRARSVDGVLSTSVLEHIQAPWLVAAEMNRVLTMGGLVYHHVPGAWPGHAQPNDFWRFSSEALRVLFGPATGFEILEMHDSAQAAIIPSPDWRRDFLDMPTTPVTAMAEILARKVEEIPDGAVAWPLSHAESELRSHQYPLAGLRPSNVRPQS
jgi:SAM-dependent methyltransferase